MELARRRATRWLVVPAAAALAAVGVSSPAYAQDTLRGAADFLVGVAVTPDWLSNGTYANIAGAEFSSVTAENHMKMETVQPNQGQFDFNQGDQIIDFAQQNGQNVYGHTLVWHSQAPGWVEGLNGTALDNAMEDHITTVMQEWSGEVSQWDVVNEVLVDDGSFRDSFWQDHTMGNGYIDEAFRIANQADPSATLCMNDFNNHTFNDAKSNAYFDMAQDMQSNGVPIDCMAFQTHLVLGEMPGTQMEQNVQRFANLGLETWITEVDIRIQLPASNQELQQQAQEYAQVFEVCQNVSTCQGTTVWGLHDAQSWVPDVFDGEGDALMWDDNFQEKPAYGAVLDQLGGSGNGGGNPPAAPTGLQVTDESTDSVSLSWNASQGATNYIVERAQGGGFSQVGTTGGTSLTDTSVSPNQTYQYQVIATNSEGNSPPSNQVSASTEDDGSTSPPPGGGGDCAVDYSANDWGGHPGFTANVSITNTGSSTIDGWDLVWDFPAGQVVNDHWSSSITQNGSVTATNAGWNATINPGQSVNFGFNGEATSVGNNPPPTAFTLNGTSCDVS